VDRYGNLSFVAIGTAMDSLSGMQSFLSSRPKCFRSLEHAIEWR